MTKCKPCSDEILKYGHTLNPHAKQMWCKIMTMIFRTFNTFNLVLVVNSLWVVGRFTKAETRPVIRKRLKNDSKKAILFEEDPRTLKTKVASSTTNQYPYSIVEASDDTNDGDVGETPLEKSAIVSEADFLNYCEGWFLASTRDLQSTVFISQSDFVDFLANSCVIFDDDEGLNDFACPYPTFTGISKKVQSVFVKHLCDQRSGTELQDCLGGLITSGSEFGYDVDPTVYPLIEEMCCDLVNLISPLGLEANADCEYALLVPSSSGTFNPSNIIVPQIPIGNRPTSSPPLIPVLSPGPTKTTEDAPTPQSINLLPISASPMDAPTPGNTPMQSLSPSVSFPTIDGTSPPTFTDFRTQPTSEIPSSEPGVNPINLNTTGNATSISAATITGIVLGVSGLFIMGVASSRRVVRGRPEAYSSDDSGSQQE